MFQKNGNYKTLEEYIEGVTGKTPEELLQELTKEYHIAGADKFKEIVDRHTKIRIFGDYDVDGVTAALIMLMCLTGLGKKGITVRFPKRISEGFGLSVKAIEEAAADGITLVVTVDNGIAANEAVARAKELGMEVIITDHHLPNEELPPADLIIDPNAVEGSADFNGYCGAGIAMKLIEELKIGNATLLNQAYPVAAIGTIADSVPMKEDNRRLVNLGLNCIRSGKGSAGLKALIKKMNIDYEHIDTENVSFSIAPALNAPGRLFDDGAKIAFELLKSTPAKAEENAQQLVELNDKRKSLVADAVSRIEEKIAKDGVKCPLIIEQEVHEGIVGIVAGQLTEKYRIPVIVLTKTEEGYKGSSRAPQGFHLKEMLDKRADLLVRYGGHAAAAGLTVKEDRLDDFISDMQGEYKDYKIPEPAHEYDLEINEEDLPKMAKDLQKYAPYGEEFQAPTFMVRALSLVPDKDGKLVKELANETVRFNFANKVNGLGKKMMSRYLELGSPDRITAVGKIGLNYWNGFVYTQLKLKGFDKGPDGYMSLAALVKQRLRELRGKTVDPTEEMTENTAV